MKRNEFLKKGAMAMAAIPLVKLGDHSVKSRFPALRFGLCADIHHDFYPGVPQKLSMFIAEMNKKRPDFIAQLGDFCMPKPENKVIMDIWNAYDGTGLHVLGNHDIEFKYSQQEVAEFWGLKKPYYSMDMNGYHIVVLDGNDLNPKNNKRVRYENHIGKEQLEWLKKDLDSTSLYTIVLCHYAIDINGLDNARTLQVLFDEVNKESGFQKIQLVFSGHHHNDFYNNINGIHYFQINSMCYAWTDKYGDTPFDEATLQKYPLLKRMNHYKDPLWAFVEIDPDGTVKLTGKKSEFLGASPYEKGLTKNYDYELRAEIRDKKIKMTRELKNAQALSFMNA